MSRHHQRAMSLPFLFAAGVLLIYVGFNGWVIYDLLPLQYVACLLVAGSLLGLVGVNIWGRWSARSKT